MLNIDDILADLEADGKILDYRFRRSGAPIYFAIRFHLLQHIINKNFGLSDPHIAEKKCSFFSKLKYYCKAVAFNTFFSTPKKVVIFSSGVVNQYDGEFYCNRLYGHFVRAFDDQIQLLEDSDKGEFHTPKNEKVYYSDFIKLSISFLSKFLRIKEEDRTQIDLFCDFLRAKPSWIGDEKDLEDIRRILWVRSREEKCSYWLYRLFFVMKKTKIVMIENAHYLGVGEASMVCAAKDVGVITAEYQHGYVGLAHPAYNFHEGIFEVARDYLPDYLLVHGQYWGGVVRTPAEIVNIGKPSLGGGDDAVPRVPPQVLFISGGTVCEELNEFLRSCYSDIVNMGYSVKLRVHPCERLGLMDRYGDLITLGVKVDEQPLSEDLQDAEIIVSMEMSTVLFEAINFSKKLYLMKTPYTDFYEKNSPFISFEDKKSFLHKLSLGAEVCVSANDIWGDDWHENVANFMDQAIALQKRVSLK